MLQDSYIVLIKVLINVRSKMWSNFMYTQKLNFLMMDHNYYKQLIIWMVILANVNFNAFHVPYMYVAISRASKE